MFVRRLLITPASWLAKFKRRPFRLFVVAIALSILLGIAQPLRSQSASSPQDGCQATVELCEQIRQMARDDAAEKKQKTQEAINFFQEAHPGWESSPIEAKLDIRRTYNREYNEQIQIQEGSPEAIWRELTENWLLGPFILAVFGLIVTAFKDTINNAFKTFTQKIDEWIYNRFAGTPLFEGEALKRYRKALVDNYQHLKIPFRANQAPLDMSQVYVPLKVKGSQDNDQIDAYSAIAQHRRLMITGIPGSGKTMLLKHVAFSYGQGKLMGLSPQPVPVLLELHRLSDPNLTEEKLIAELVEAFKRNQFPKAERFVRLSLQKGTLMLLLDGLDEVNSATRPYVGQRIKDLLQSFDEQRCCRVIVTCRTAVYDHEFADSTDQTLEVVEFTDQQMRRFLDPWQGKMPAGKSIDQLMQTLRDRPRIMALARNPLLLTIIVHLYTDPSFELPRSRTEFYQKSTQLLLEQWQDKFNNYRGNDKRRVLQYLALHHQRSSTQQQRDPRSMDYTVVLQQIREVLPSLNLNPDVDTIPLLDEIVERSGLFMKIDGGDRYQFAHLTLQEYFAAVALADKPDELIQHFQQNPNHWREVVKLWCGIAGNSTALIQQVYQTDAITGFECLADAQEVDQGIADSIIEHFKGELDEFVITDSIPQAFAAVASNDRPRGRTMFQFLVDTLDDETKILQRVISAQAIALTNLPEAATILAERYDSHSPIVSFALVRMGDIAIAELVKLARHGKLAAIDDLYKIGTPDAAKALARVFLERQLSNHGLGAKVMGVPFWSNQRTSRAAWYLASLLPKSGIEDALIEFAQAENEQITDSENIWKPFDWVWAPFQNPNAPSSANRAITAIVGCIAAEISQEIIADFLSPEGSVEGSMSQVDLQTDVRIGVPLVFHHVRFDQSWNSTFDPLIETQDQTRELEHEQIQAINTVFASTQPDTGWRRLLTGLSPRLQLDLVRGIATVTRRPIPRDWREIFQSLKYNFQSSWEYRSVLLISAVLTLIASLGIWNVAALDPKSPTVGALGLAIAVVFIVWATVSRGIDTPWEPTLFIQLGPAGIVTYFSELRRLWQKRLVWNGINSMVDSLVRHYEFACACAFAFAVAGALAVAGADVFAFAVAGAFASAFLVALVFANFVAVFVVIVIADAVTKAVTDAVTDAVAVAVAFAFAVAFASASAGADAGDFVLAFVFAFAVAGAGAGAGVLAGIGLGAWYQAKQEPDNRGLRYLAVLVLPWFCAAPIVVGFAAVGLHYGLSLLALPFGAVWVQALGVEGVLVVLGCVLWWRGQWLERRSRNPLQGGLIEKMLREKYGHLHR